MHFFNPLSEQKMVFKKCDKTDVVTKSTLVRGQDKFHFCLFLLELLTTLEVCKKTENLQEVVIE